MEEYTIDAKGKSLGRVASEAAKVLQGKHKPDYTPHKRGNTRVIVSNVEDIQVSGKKAEQKVYYSHPTTRAGRLKTKTYKQAFEEDPQWVVRHAISGMLPKNRLRDKRMKLLSFEATETTK